MLKSGLLNPHLLSLVARVRHTNLLVIADRGFPSWPGLETIDLSLVDNLPTVNQALAAILPHWTAGRAHMAEEFMRHNSAAILKERQALLGAIPLVFEPHVDFKRRVPGAIGLIRTGDAIPYSNIILESA